MILALDPGPKETAYLLKGDCGRIHAWGKLSNDQASAVVASAEHRHGDTEGPVPVVCEMIACYGMAVGAEVFDTAVWIGEYRRICRDRGIPWHTLTRAEVKQRLCHHTVGVNDSVIRKRLIDLYGGKDKAIGRKASPGPLYKVKSDVWAALAVATAWEIKP